MPLTERSTNLQPRKDDGCVYTAEAGKEQYTRPADNTQTVRAATVNGGTGGGTAEISTSRTQEWSTSMSAGVNILEIVSASVSFEMSESVTDSTAYTFSVPAGQTGQVGFTANLRCTSGMFSLSLTPGLADTIGTRYHRSMLRRDHYFWGNLLTLQRI